jgi:hypothetical protein
MNKAFDIIHRSRAPRRNGRRSGGIVSGSQCPPRAVGVQGTEDCAMRLLGGLPRFFEEAGRRQDRIAQNRRHHDVTPPQLVLADRRAQAFQGFLKLSGSCRTISTNGSEVTMRNGRIKATGVSARRRRKTPFRLRGKNDRCLTTVSSKLPPPKGTACKIKYKLLHLQPSFPSRINTGGIK